MLNDEQRNTYVQKAIGENIERSFQLLKQFQQEYPHAAEAKGQAFVHEGYPQTNWFLADAHTRLNGIFSALKDGRLNKAKSDIQAIQDGYPLTDRIANMQSEIDDKTFQLFASAINDAFMGCTELSERGIVRGSAQSSLAARSSSYPSH